MKKQKLLLLLLFSLLSILVATAVYAGNPNPGSASVNFTVMNKNSSGDAAVVGQYVNLSGQVDATVNATISPLASAGFPIGDAGLPDGWAGSVIISSDQDIAAFAQMSWNNGANGDGRTAGAYNGFSAGATTLYFPSLKARDGKQFSVLSVQSAETASTSETITFDVDFYNRDGSLAHSLTNVSINKGTQKSYDLLDDVTLPADWNGSATVTSSSPIAGAATTHWATYSTAYSGVSTAGTTAYVPEARRRLKNGAWDQYAGIVVQNLDTVDAADVTVEWYDRSGNLLHSFNDIIAANSSNGYNTQFGADIPDYNAFAAAVGDTWNGSLKITSTNSKNIVAVTNLQWTETSGIGAAATSFTSESAGSSQVLIPASFRRGTGSDWKQFTGLIVQNIGNSTCTDFDVTWVDRNGVTQLSYQDSLAIGISHGYNTRYGADVPAGADVADLGDDFRGSVNIESTGCDLIAIHNTVWPLQTDSTTYQGVKN